jgi:tripartite-type tricarboxylate transporter receptor subunit TctC
MPSHVLAPAMNRNAGFDPLRDFAHIAYLGGPPNVFAVHSSVPVKTFRELLDLMRKEPAGLEYVSPGIGSVGNMVAEYVAAKEHVKLTHVVYRGGGAAILDLVAGHVTFGSMTLATMGQHIKAGTLRPLAISSAESAAGLPEVPTLVELGYPELVVRTWYGISGPAGLAPEIVDKINAAVNAAMDLPKVKQQLAGEAVETKAMTPAEFTRFMKDQVGQWVPAVRDMGLVH